MSFPTYQKIPNIFKRSPDGREVLLGEFVNPYLKYLASGRWFFTEKVDGTNIRVCWDGHGFHFLGRTDRAQIPQFLLDYLTREFEPREEVFEELFGEKSVVLFGEGYGRKIQKSGSRYKGDGVGFILFDVMVDGFYLNRESVEDVASRLGLAVVPVVLRGTLYDGVKFVQECPRSVVAEDPDLVMEGVVGFPEVPLYDKMGNRVAVKIKCRDFR